MRPDVVLQRRDVEVADQHGAPTFAIKPGLAPIDTRRASDGMRRSREWRGRVAPPFDLPLLDVACVPDGVRVLLAVLGCTASEALLVGDSSLDLAAASAAGTGAALAVWYLRTPEPAATLRLPRLLLGQPVALHRKPLHQQHQKLRRLRKLNPKNCQKSYVSLLARLSLVWKKAK